MNDFYTFIVTSTLNTVHGVIDPQDRFNQTIESLESIRRHVPNSRIIFSDNSTVPLTTEQIEFFKTKADYVRTVDHNLFTLVANQYGYYKGPAEIYMMREVLDFIERENLIGKRIFKLSGRYKISDTFDIKEYDQSNKINRYCFRINPWDVSDDNWKTRRTIIHFEGRLWSFCSSLYKQFKIELLPKILDCMLYNNLSMEQAFFYCIPHDKVFELNWAHVEGYTANDNVYKGE